MSYGSISGPIGLNSYNSLFGRSANDVQSLLDPGSMITNMTSSYLGMSGQVGWGSSPSLLSNPYMNNPYINGGNSLWSLPSSYGLPQYNSPYGMMGMNPYMMNGMNGFNPMLSQNPYLNPYGFLQPQMSTQQQSLSWNALLTGLMGYLQTQPQAPVAATPTVLPQPPVQTVDNSQVAAAVQALAQAPLRNLPTPAPAVAAAPSFSATVMNSQPFTTPSGVTPPARWARSASPSNNVFAAAYPPAVASAPIPAPAPLPAPVPAPVVAAPAPVPAPSSNGGLFSGLVQSGFGRPNGLLGGIGQGILQNLPMINVGKAADKKPGQVIKNVIKNFSSSHGSDKDDKPSGGISRGAFGMAKAWKNNGH